MWRKQHCLLCWWHYPIFLRKGNPDSNFSSKIFHWFQDNHLKANPGKGHFLLSSQTPTDVSIGDVSIKTSAKETLLGILIDSELSFDQHIFSICSKASKKLHALGRIATFMLFNKRRTQMKAFIENQLNYCPLMWMFHSRTMNNKINRIHERTLRLVFLITSRLLMNFLKRPIIFYSPQEHSKSSYWTLQFFSWSFSKYHEKCLPF